MFRNNFKEYCKKLLEYLMYDCHNIQTAITNRLIPTIVNFKNYYWNVCIRITSGLCPDNPAEFLGTPRLSQLIYELQKPADLIIFDSPALLPINDATIPASKMDYCLLVTRNLWSPIEAVKQALSQLNQIGCNVVWFCL